MKIAPIKGLLFLSVANTMKTSFKFLVCFRILFLVIVLTFFVGAAGIELNCNETCQAQLKLPKRYSCKAGSVFDGRSCSCVEGLVRKRDINGSIECLEPCGKGTYYQEENFDCSVCPAGTFKPFQGDSVDECRPCPTDAFSLDSRTTCQCLQAGKLFNISEGTCVCSQDAPNLELINPQRNWAAIALRKNDIQTGSFFRSNTPFLEKEDTRIFKEPFSEENLELLDCELISSPNGIAAIKLPRFFNNGTMNWGLSDEAQRNLSHGRYNFRLRVHTSCGFKSDHFFSVEVLLFDFQVNIPKDSLIHVHESVKNSFGWSIQGLDRPQDSFKASFGLVSGSLELVRSYDDLEYYLGSGRVPGEFSWTPPLISEEKQTPLSLVVIGEIFQSSQAHNGINEQVSRFVYFPENVTYLIQKGFYVSADAFSECRPLEGSHLCKPIKQTREVTCKNSYSDEEVPMQFCVMAGIEIPSTSRYCTVKECPWEISSWSKCSKTCGGGTQKRVIRCSLGGNCNETMPSILQFLPLTKSCNTFMCSLPELQNSTNRTIGYAKVNTCVDKNVGIILNLEECGSSVSSLDLEGYGKDYASEWLVTPWGQCDQTCGGGRMYRNVSCVQGQSDLDCSTKKPASEAICNTLPCEMYALQNGKCLNEEYDEVDYSNCSEFHKPSEKDPVNECGILCSGNLSAISSTEVLLSQTVNETLQKKCGYMEAKLSVDGTCCLSNVLDFEGKCCISGNLDACGVCNGKNKYVDMAGRCCKTTLDSGGYCCDSGRLDRCGVCNGDGSTCRTQIYGIDRNSSIFEKIEKYKFRSTRFLDEIPQAEEVLEATGITDDALADILTSSEKEISLNSFDIDVSGFCGNGFCEIGELCTNEENSDSSCCPSDCIFPIKSCPEGCQGKGKCVPTTGECDCFLSSGAANFPDNTICSSSNCRVGYFMTPFGCISTHTLKEAVCKNGDLVITDTNSSGQDILNIECEVKVGNPDVVPMASSSSNSVVIAAASGGTAVIGLGLLFFSYRKRKRNSYSSNVDIPPTTVSSRVRMGSLTDWMKTPPKPIWQMSPKPKKKSNTLVTADSTGVRNVWDDTEAGTADEGGAVGSTISIHFRDDEEAQYTDDLDVPPPPPLLASKSHSGNPKSKKNSGVESINKRKLSTEKVAAENWAKVQVKRSNGSKTTKEYYLVFHGIENEIRYYSQMVPSSFGNVFGGHKGTIPMRNIASISSAKNSRERVKIKMKSDEVRYKLSFKDADSAIYWKMLINTALLDTAEEASNLVYTPRSPKEKSSPDSRPKKVQEAPPLPPYSKSSKKLKAKKSSSSSSTAKTKRVKKQKERNEGASASYNSEMTGARERNTIERLDDDPRMYRPTRTRSKALSRKKKENRAAKESALSPTADIWSNYQSELGKSTERMKLSRSETEEDVRI